MSAILPRRGEVWLLNLDPTVGREQAGRRPVLIVSIDGFNAGPGRLMVALPITSTRRGIDWHVPIDPPEGGLDRPSVIMCEQVRSLAVERLGRRIGRVSDATLDEVGLRLRVLLDL